jgi:hypothetical protein
MKWSTRGVAAMPLGGPLQLLVRRLAQRYYWPKNATVTHTLRSSNAQDEDSVSAEGADQTATPLAARNLGSEKKRKHTTDTPPSSIRAAHRMAPSNTIDHGPPPAE